MTLQKAFQKVRLTDGRVFVIHDPEEWEASCNGYHLAMENSLRLHDLFYSAYIAMFYDGKLAERFRSE